jgi:hypothetical protein
MTQIAVTNRIFSSKATIRRRRTRERAAEVRGLESLTQQVAAPRVRCQSASCQRPTSFSLWRLRQSDQRQQRCDHRQRPRHQRGLEDRPPQRRLQVRAQDPGLGEIGGVEPSDVDPPLMRQSHHEPKPRRQSDKKPPRQQELPTPTPNYLVEDEIGLESVGKDREQQTQVAQLERKDAC